MTLCGVVLYNMSRWGSASGHFRRSVKPSDLMSEQSVWLKRSVCLWVVRTGAGLANAVQRTDLFHKFALKIAPLLRVQLDRNTIAPEPLIQQRLSHDRGGLVFAWHCLRKFRESPSSRGRPHTPPPPPPPPPRPRSNFEKSMAGQRVEEVTESGVHRWCLPFCY